MLAIGEREAAPRLSGRRNEIKEAGETHRFLDASPARGVFRVEIARAGRVPRCDAGERSAGASRPANLRDRLYYATPGAERKSSRENRPKSAAKASPRPGGAVDPRPVASVNCVLARAFAAPSPRPERMKTSP